MPWWGFDGHQRLQHQFCRVIVWRTHPREYHPNVGHNKIDTSGVATLTYPDFVVRGTRKQRL
ncbi:MAG: hypothetical protein ACLTGI_07265 [Hoylesella buccalis]